MINFSDREVEIIQTLLKSNGVRSSALLDDLTDHVCCVVEEVMMDGGTFRSGVIAAMGRFDNGQALKLVERDRGYELASIKTKGEQVGFVLDKFMVLLYLVSTAALCILPVVGGIVFSTWILPLVLSPLMFACAMVWVKGVNFKKFDLEWN